MAAIPAARCISCRSGRSSEPGCEAGTHPSTGWAEGTACHQSGTPSLTGLQSWHGAITQSNENIIATDGAGWDGMGRDGMDSPRDRRLAAAAARSLWCEAAPPQRGSTRRGSPAHPPSEHRRPRPRVRRTPPALVVAQPRPCLSRNAHAERHLPSRGQQMSRWP